jgi:hypothetical protein
MESVNYLFVRACCLVLGKGQSSGGPLKSDDGADDTHLAQKEECVWGSTSRSRRKLWRGAIQAEAMATHTQEKRWAHASMD